MTSRHPIIERAASAMPTVVSYFVYVIRNRAGILYTGIAKDVEARCAQHNDGCGARFTRGRGPWVVVHREGPFSHGDALRRELTVKADRRLKAMIKARGKTGSAARATS